MIWILFGVLVAGEAAKLDNTYLPPPPGAKESGGSGSSLELPLEPPYIDQYSPNSIQPQVWRPGTRAVHVPAAKPVVDEKYLENEEEITVPDTQKGRFISGSYSYTGPDNVLVTVTYKANDKKGSGENKEEEEEGEEEDVVEEERSESAEEDSDDDAVVPTPSSLPSELARAFDFHKKKHSQQQEEKTNKSKKPIRRTHNKKGQRPHQKGEAETEDHYAVSSRPDYESSRPIRPSYDSSRPGQSSFQTSQSRPGHPTHSSDSRPGHASQQSDTRPGTSGYHYNQPQGLYGAPTIHQGYSYPKQV